MVILSRYRFDLDTSLAHLAVGVTSRDERDDVVSLARCRRRRAPAAAQATAQNRPELLAADAVDDEVGRRAEHLEDVAQFHQQERGRRTALRVVLPDDLQPRISRQE